MLATVQIIRAYFFKHIGQVTLLFLLIFVSVGTQLLSPQILRSFIDGAQAGLPMEKLWMTAAIFLGFVICHQALSIAVAYSGSDLAWKGTNSLRSDLFKHILSLGSGFHQNIPAGQLVERIDGDVSTLSNLLSQFTVKLATHVLLLTGILCALFLEDWRLGVPMSGFSMVVLLILFFMRNMATTAWKKARTASADLYGYIEERLSGVLDIRSNGGEFDTLRGLERCAGNRLKTEVDASVKNARIRMTLHILYFFGQAIALWLAYTLSQEGSLTIGGAFMVVHYAHTLFIPLRELSSQVEDFQKSNASGSRVIGLLNEKPSIHFSGKSSLPNDPAVHFENVNFSYGQHPTLHHVSFSLPSGQSLGILGRTGSGKSTLIRLLLRLYEPSAGRIYLGNAAIHNISRKIFRSKVGVVTQELDLLDASIRDNLALFDHTISDDDIISILRITGLTSLLNRFEWNLNSRIRPSDLSAGEAQLLSLARVALRNPSLIVLDEAASRIDPISEQHLWQTLDTLSSVKTKIVIAHRLETIRRMDYVLILESGRVKEFGLRMELHDDRDSLYHQILKDVAKGENI